LGEKRRVGPIRCGHGDAGKWRSIKRRGAHRSKGLQEVKKPILQQNGMTFKKGCWKNGKERHEGRKQRGRGKVKRKEVGGIQERSETGGSFMKRMRKEKNG